METEANLGRKCPYDTDHDNKMYKEEHVKSHDIAR